MKKLLVLGATQYVMVNKEIVMSSKETCKLIFHDDNALVAGCNLNCIV